jgi:hypothetical protein
MTEEQSFGRNQSILHVVTANTGTKCAKTRATPGDPGLPVRPKIPRMQGWS